MIRNAILEKKNDRTAITSKLASRPYVLGIVEIPVCGKTTRCSILTNVLNDIGYIYDDI